MIEYLIHDQNNPSALQVKADLLVFFFFQAEDGIRVGTVTGVQTCALPIWLDYFGYDPAWRFPAELEPAEPETRRIGSSGEEPVTFTRFAIARFGGQELEVFWLDAYGGGLFLPFRDATAGAETYGAGRYLLDTVKGADLGTVDGRILLDFNFAYNPSCAYDPKWACPLAPPANRLTIPISAGEKKPEVGLEPTASSLQGTRSTS